ncbi:BsuPI-related putative proteinase inhibitor [Marininema halotolerans]|uniref:Immunoglobulin-like domain of spore germination n=1 Tax=Marininema halotolerans TaxID=1155944 RepID=A0A1I6UJW4_9BACL|nr:BsuPI-related putative proteinase inhibitor [Marininema halotolerans]SFT01718.1 Immunoglobulin-like domain of spore germination [Marininema halotolerans]
MKERRWIVWSGGVLIIALVWISGGCFNKKEAPTHRSPSIQLDMGLQMEEKKGVAQFHWGIVNRGKDEAKLTFASGQQTELTVTDPKGRVIYRWPKSSFSKGSTRVRLEPEDQLNWSATWDPSLHNEPVMEGTYHVTADVLITTINGAVVNEGYLRKQTTWTVTNRPRKPRIPSITLPGEQENVSFRRIQVTGQAGLYHVQGETRVFEGVFHYAVSDGHRYLTEGVLQVGGAPLWSPFDFEISIPHSQLPTNGTLTLELFAESPKDGSRLDPLSIPIEDFR